MVAVIVAGCLVVAVAKPRQAGFRPHRFDGRCRNHGRSGIHGRGSNLGRGSTLGRGRTIGHGQAGLRRAVRDDRSNPAGRPPSAFGAEL